MNPFSCPPILENLPDTWQGDGLIFSITASPFATMLIESGSMPRSDALDYAAHHSWPAYCADYFNTIEDMTSLCTHFTSVFPSPRHTTLYWVGKDDCLVGSLSVYTPKAEYHTRDCSDTLCLGYHVMESQRKQGLGSRMVRAFQDLAVAKGFTALCAESNWHNSISHKVLLNAGFADFGLQPTSVTTPCESVESICRRFMWQAQTAPAHESAWPYAPGLAARLLPAPR